MSISVLCPNGHKLTAKEKLAGKRVKCPKCGSVVQIPELELPELDDGLLIDESAPQPESDMDWLASGEASSSAMDDPLGFGQGFEESDPLAGDGAAMDGALSDLPDVPSLSASSYAPVKAPINSPPAKQEPASKLNKTLILAIAGGGSFVGLLCVGVVGWLLFGGSGDKEVAATKKAAPAAAVEQRPPEEAAPLPQAQATPDPIEKAPAPTPEPEPAEPAREPEPFDLVRLNLDTRLDGFKLPGPTWAAAYDEVTGRLAITNDEQGILIYDLDELLKGDPGPVATIPTKGLPTAVCLKPLPDRRVFVIAGQDAPELLLIDAETLRPTGRLVLSELKYVNFLTGSTAVDDPYVYYSTHKYKRNGPTPSEMEDNKTAERLGRVDLVTGKLDAHTQAQFIDATVSPDGQRLYTRGNGRNGVIGPWSEILKLSGSSGPSAESGLSPNYAQAPVCFVGELVADKYSVYTPLMTVRSAAMDYTIRAAFRQQPVVVGLAKGEVVIGSANDYRRLASIALPATWFDTERWGPPNDFRLRHNLAPDIRTAYLDVQTDSTREAALITFSDHLVIASLPRAKVAVEPSLVVKASPPAKVVAGELVEVKLDQPTEGVVFEFVPNTDWLPNEKMPLLGLLPPGQPSPRALELRASVSANQSFVILESYEPLAGLKMPFKLRIGNEVMVAVKYDKNRLIVQRANPVVHGSSERIEAVDDEGRILTTADPASKPLGKRLVLAAALNNQQDVIFLNDIRPLAGQTLPATIQIGDEKMTLLSVDDFKTALKVTRTEPVAHGVSSDAWLLEEDAASSEATPNLPVVQGRTFRWTPSAEQLGKQTIRMRATAGNVTHEWFWEITVERPIAELPFQVAGIEPQRGTELAVIWGQSGGLALHSPAAAPDEPTDYFIGIYDLAEKKLVHHVKVPKPIMTATLHETGVYATLVSFDMEPKTDRQAELARQRAMTQVTPTQIVRFDVESLNISEQVAISNHSRNLSIVADKYLTTFVGGENLRFKIPDLTLVEPAVRGYEYPISGRVGNRWVWDGVVWDEQMKKPQLLLFPVQFEQPPGVHSPPQMLCAMGGTINMMTDGPYACTWFPINQGPLGQHRLTDFPGGLNYQEGALIAYSWAAPSRPRVGEAAKQTSVQLIDRQTLSVKSGNTYGIKKTSAYLTDADGQVHAALLGQLYSVPLAQLVQEEEAFRFVEQQDQFVLDVGKPAKLRYSAPGAAKYHFQLWYQRPHFHDEEPAITAESTDGTFELALNETERYAGYALSAVGVRATDRTAKERVARVQGHMKIITPAYQNLTGRKPRGVPFPVYISVIAEHEDGQQKAGLAHAYLLEVPSKQILEMVNR